MDENQSIAPFADGYRIIETDQLQSDSDGDKCYAVIDRSQRVVWLWKETPAEMRNMVISEAMQSAARVVEKPVLSL